MSTAILGSENRLHLIWTLNVVVICAIFILCLFQNPKTVRASIETELKYSSQQLQSEFKEIERLNLDRYNRWWIESGLQRFVHQLLPEKEQSDYAKHMQENASLGYIADITLTKFVENVELYLYQIIHRLTLLQFWCLTMLPFMAAVVITGYYHWRIKFYSLTGQSTTSVRLWLKISWIVIFIFSIYLITPNLFGTYTVFAPPILLALLSIMISYILKNFSKST